MIEIRSFMRGPSGLVPVEQYVGPVPDPEYVEGSIEIIVRGEPLLLRSEEDLVDQLWAYLVNLSQKVLQGRAARTYFPDQPINVEMSPNGRGSIEIRVSYDRVDRRASVETAALLGALCEAGRVYWNRHMVFSPSNVARATRELARLDALERAIPS